MRNFGIVGALVVGAGVVVFAVFALVKVASRADDMAEEMQSTENAKHFKDSDEDEDL